MFASPVSDDGSSAQFDATIVKTWRIHDDLNMRIGR